MLTARNIDCKSSLRSSIESVCVIGEADNADIKGTAFHVIRDDVVVYQVRQVGQVTQKKEVCINMFFS